MLQDGQVLMTRQDGQVQLVGQGRQKQSGGFTAGMPFIFSSSTEGTRTRTPTIMGTSPPSPLLCSSRGSFYSLFVQLYHPSNFFPSGSSTMISDNHFVPYLLSFVSLSLYSFSYSLYSIERAFAFERVGLSGAWFQGVEAMGRF